MIKNTKEYRIGYASDLIRGTDIDKRPWNLQQEILNLSKTSFNLLDIGSGDSRKVMPLSKHFNHIVAMEPSLEMRELASKAVQRYNLKNMTIVNGIADKLPFPDSSFDMVTCSLAPWNILEIYRVLKSGGLFINETIGCADKLEFKKEFGHDENGIWRGQLIQFEESEYLANIKADVERKLSLLSLKNGFWNTAYTSDGLLELCKLTPTIKDFDIKKDSVKFNNIVEKLKTKDVIKIQQNRILCIAVKN